MPSKQPVQRLADIVENIQAIAEFTALPNAFKQNHSEIDWTGLAAVGNVCRHEYDIVDDSLVWHTIQHDLEPLRQVTERELLRLTSSQ